MDETLMLARLVIAKNRTWLTVSVIWVLASLVITAVGGAVFGGKQVFPILMLATFPLMLGSLAIFDVGFGGSLTDGHSSYSHWLLRMPIANWKLAFVPLALRFTWIAFYYFVVVATSTFEGTPLPFWTGFISFCACGAWVSAIAWRPSRGPWRRMGLILLAGVAMYILPAIVMAVHFGDFNKVPFLGDHRLFLETSMSLLITFVLASGVGFSLSAVKLARTHSRGIVSEQQTQLTRLLGLAKGSSKPIRSPVRHHSSGCRALAWHDLHRVIDGDQRWFLLLQMIGLLGIALVPLSLAIWISMMALILVAGSTGFCLLDPPKSQGSSLPVPIAVSRLTCAEIGFTRGLLGIGASFVGCLVIAIALFACIARPSHQEILGSWVQQMNEHYGLVDAGYRWIGLAVLLCVAVVPSASLWGTGATMTGRSRLASIALVSPACLFLVTAGVITSWFLAQPDLESATANAWYWASWIPTGLWGLVGIKFLLAALAAILSVRKNLIRPRTVVAVTACWIIVTIALAFACQALIPDPRFLFSWTIMVAVLAVPLGRILFLPCAVSLNRYR